MSHKTKTIHLKPKLPPEPRVPDSMDVIVDIEQGHPTVAQVQSGDQCEDFLRQPKAPFPSKMVVWSQEEPGALASKTEHPIA